MDRSLLSESRRPVDTTRWCTEILCVVRVLSAAAPGLWPCEAFSAEQSETGGWESLLAVVKQAWFWLLLGVCGVISFLVRRLILRERKLTQTLVALESAHFDLERRVQLRTAELAEANRLLQQEMYERKQAVKELVRVERLGALSELAAGVSHNMNNLLTGILGPAELIESVHDPDKQATYIEMIVKSARRMAEVVSRLHLSVAKDALRAVGETRLEAAVLSAVDMTRPRWKDEAEARGVAIAIHTDFSQTPPVLANEQDLNNVIAHIIFNAVDAIPDRGSITFRTVCNDRQVLLTIEDTGCGMDASVSERAFDPFFSTKRDVGSGLGLSIVKGTLQRWGAAVGIESQANIGTKLTLTFPVLEEPESRTSDAPALPAPPPRKRVLVVDDEDVVLRIIETALHTHHDVDVALSGEEGLRLFKKNTYDLVLIDLGMPNIPGDQVAKQMKEKSQTVMTLMVTGWKLDSDDERLAWFDGLITKPFESLNALRDFVARLAIAHEERISGGE
jgi:signal transduction histidine kinase/CheY-like chemotaxis protein